MKAVLPEAMKELGAQAVLANAYHLYLQPGADIVEDAGGLGAFMNWPGPTFTDSGGFQVLSLGAGFRKVLAMDTERVQADDIIAEGKERLARVDDDGVTFTSHLDGSTHRFTPEVSIGIQHQIGADIIFAFDELTTLVNTRGYQEESVQRTHRWAVRCLAEHRRLAGGQPGPAAAGAVRRGAGGPVRGPATGSDARAGVRSSTTTAAASTATASAVRWRSRISPRSSAGSAASCPPTNRDTCWGSASPTTFSTRRRGRRHIRLRVTVTRRAQRGGVLGDRPLQHHRRPLPPRLHAPSTPNVTATHARITPAPTFTTCSRPRRSVRHAVHDPQRAVHHQARRPDPDGDQGR